MSAFVIEGRSDPAENETFEVAYELLVSVLSSKKHSILDAGHDE